MGGMRPQDSTVECECCELTVPERHAGPITVAGLVRGWRCRMCNDHQGDALRKAQDHEYELRVRWGETADELIQTQYKADDYRDKMKAAYRSRDSVLTEMERLGQLHRATDDGCSCGKKRKCETQDIVHADWVTELIARMHRHNAR